MENARTDGELVSACLAGDRSAFGLLIDRHRARVAALVGRMLPREDAEDVTQDALLHAYLGLRELRTPDRFGAWLAAIAVNLAKMRLRELRAAPDPFVEADDGARLDEVVDALELFDVVSRALQALPVRQRQVVLMHYFGGLTSDEVATALGERSGAVRTRLHRGRRRLQSQLTGLREERRTMVEVTLHDVVVRVSSEDAESETPRLASERVRIVLLKERGGDRVLPIWIGPPEADALALQLGGASTPRPLTADLMARLLEATGARVERVTVSSLREKTFYATVTIATSGDSKEVDARPSDALNLAARVGAPIYVASELLEKAISADDIEGGLDRERQELGAEADPGGSWRSLSPELVWALHGPPPGCK